MNPLSLHSKKKDLHEPTNYLVLITINQTKIRRQLAWVRQSAWASQLIGVNQNGLAIDLALIVLSR